MNSEELIQKLSNILLWVGQRNFFDIITESPLGALRSDGGGGSIIVYPGRHGATTWLVLVALLSAIAEPDQDVNITSEWSLHNKLEDLCRWARIDLESILLQDNTDKTGDRRRLRFMNRSTITMYTYRHLLKDSNLRGIGGDVWLLDDIHYLLLYPKLFNSFIYEVLIPLAEMTKSLVIGLLQVNKLEIGSHFVAGGMFPDLTKESKTRMDGTSVEYYHTTTICKFPLPDIIKMFLK